VPQEKWVSLGRVAGMGLLSAALFGFFTGLIADSWWVGVLGGVFYGVCMTFAMRHSWGSTALTGLKFAQRRRVTQALRRGEPMHDPQLAPALVKHGKALLATPFRPKAARIAFAVVLVLGVAASVLGFIDEGAAGLVSGLLLIVIALVMIFVVVPWNARTRERIARSVEATEHRQPERVE
jgi:hypothetical protein